MPEKKKAGPIGTGIALLGTASLVSSLVMAMVFGITGATMHNVMQLGGILVAITGYVLSKKGV